MSTDPFVPTRLDDEPRQERNLAPGVTLPPARPWRPVRPGDLEGGQPTGPLLGRPGPNVGYAVTLTKRLRDRLALAPHEHAEDALAVIAEIAMERAATFGRAPVLTDVECAALILGYVNGADPQFAAWRAKKITGAGHDYQTRRGWCDAVPLDELRLAPSALVPRLPDIRARIRAALDGSASTVEPIDLGGPVEPVWVIPIDQP